MPLALRNLVVRAMCRELMKKADVAAARTRLCVSELAI